MGNIMDPASDLNQNRYLLSMLQIFFLFGHGRTLKVADECRCRELRNGLARHIFA